MTKRIAYMPLVTYPDAVPDAPVSAAIALATALGCDVEATAFAVDIPNVRSPLGGLMLNIPEMIRTAEATSLARCEELQSLVLKDVGDKTGAQFVVRRTDPSQTAATAAVEARYADLALVPWWPDSIMGSELAQAVVFGAGRPTILVPGAARVAPTDRLAIAWDGSRVAARALADAMSLLPGIAHVTVLTVHDEKPLGEEDLAERLVASLQRRGLDAAAVRVMLEKRTIGTALQEAAIAAGAGLLAMGGFGHSRLRDFIVGGATKGVFTDLRLPVLLSH